MTALLSPSAKQQFFDDAGNPAAGFRLFTYAANTTTPEATYTDRAGTVANANPIILDARGEATVYLTPGIVYDYVLKTAADVTVWTREDVSADAGDAAAVFFDDTLAPAYLKTVSDIINGERVSVLRTISKPLWAGIRAETDSSALDAGINAILSDMAAVGYGDLYFPAGAYGLAACLTIPSNVTLTGVRGKTWLRPEYDPAGGVLLLEVSGKSNVTVRGIGFDGRIATMTNFVNVVTTFQSSDVVFEDCNWKDCKGVSAIFSTDVARSGVRKSTFSNCGTYHLTSLNNADRRQAIALTSGTQANNLFNFAEDNQFRDIGLDCISIGNQSHFTASRNKINRNYAGAIYDSGSIYSNVVGNHIVSAGGNAIDVNGADYGVYNSNTILNPVAAGVMLAGDCAGATVVGNNIRGAMQDAATVHKGAITLDAVNGPINHVTIAGNVCEGNLGWGFYVRPGFNPQGAIVLDPFSNHFANNTLGNVSGLDTAYYGGQSKTTYSVAAGGTLTLMPVTGGSPATANHAIIDVVDSGANQLGSFLCRGAAAMQELLDLGAVFEPTDTGVNTAVYYDAGSARIVLKNRSADTKSYRINIRGIGQSVA